MTKLLNWDGKGTNQPHQNRRPPSMSHVNQPFMLLELGWSWDRLVRMCKAVEGNLSKGLLRAEATYQ